MARKKALRSTERGTPRDARGRGGPARPPGQDGELIAQLGNVLARVTQEMEDVQRTVQAQSTRIAELQAELDDLRGALKARLTYGRRRAL
jgi:ssDNA-binding replication factor A large subunit